MKNELLKAGIFVEDCHHVSLPNIQVKLCETEKTTGEMVPGNCKSNRKIFKVEVKKEAENDSDFRVVLTRTVVKSVWSGERCGSWWCIVVEGSFKEEDWISNFRMSHRTSDFFYRCLKVFRLFPDLLLLPFLVRLLRLFYFLLNLCKCTNVFAFSLQSSCNL